MNHLFSKFIKSEEGVTALEYGLIGGLVALAIVTALSTLGTNLSTTFTQIADAVATNVKPATNTTAQQ
jgi:pilus assembly protein Flp/PilA